MLVFSAPHMHTANGTADNKWQKVMALYKKQEEQGCIFCVQEGNEGSASMPRKKTENLPWQFKLWEVFLYY